MRKRIRLRVSRMSVSRTPQVPAFCAACGREVETLTVGEAARLLDVGPQTVERLLAQHAVHGVPLASGRHRVCRDSLFVR